MASARPKKPKNVVKVNSNPVPTPVKTNTYVEKPSSQSKYDWSEHRWNAKEGTGPYGEPTFNKNAKVPPIKVNTNPVPGKTVIGPLARGGSSGGILSAALGAVAAYNQEAKRISDLKKKSNRMN